jgi:hypothetical protein
MKTKQNHVRFLLALALLAMSQLFCGSGAKEGGAPVGVGVNATQVAQTVVALQGEGDQPGGSDPTATSPPQGGAPAQADDLPTITAEQDTNCRAGPGQDYAVEGFLLLGQASQVHGREQSGNWWYIANPGKPGEFCWVWEGSTQVSGDPSGLPVVEAQPLPQAPAASTPTTTPYKAAPPAPPPEPPDDPPAVAPVEPQAAFKIRFVNIHACDDHYTMVIEAMNTGEVDFGTAYLSWGSAITNDKFSSAQAGILSGPNDCGADRFSLAAGERAFLHATILADKYANLPDRLFVEVNLCEGSWAPKSDDCPLRRIEFDAP